MTFSKNNIALIYTGVLMFGFFVSGVFDLLDLIIVKILLFSGFGVLGAILVWIAVKDQQSESK